MTVQQTSQLIQLILNSVLMVNASAIVLAILMLRYGMVHNQLRSLNQTYIAELEQEDSWWSKHLLRVNRQLRLLQQRYRSTVTSVFIVQSAVVTFATSTLLLTLRTILSIDWLITGSLWLFIIGIVVLLAGVAIAFLDIYHTGRLLREDISRGQRRLQEPETRAIASKRSATRPVS